MVDFSSLLPKTKSKTSSYYWSIVIEPSWVQAGIWSINQGESKVLTVGKPVSRDENEDLISVVDTALSSAVQNLDEDIDDPSAAVFGLSSQWILEGNIKGEYLKDLEKVCKELSLDPQGYVVLPEAIANFIKSEDGVPFTGIILGLREGNLEVSLFKNGENKGIENVSRSVSLVDDVVEGLTRLYSGEVFPSRFIVYNAKDSELEDARQELVKFDWSTPEKISFLHTPKVETFKPEQKIFAVTLAGGIEMANTSKIDTGTEVAGNPNSPKGDVGDVGFVVGKDITDESLEDQNPDENKYYSDNIASVEELEGELEDQEFTKEDTNEKRKLTIPPFFSAIKSKLSGVKVKKPKSPAGPGRRILAIVIIALLLLIGSVVAYWYFIPKASLTIFISPQNLEDRLTVYIDPEASNLDIEKNVIPGRVMSATVSGDRTKSTTGKRTIGEKAKGTVEVRNGTSSSIRLPVGTKLTSDNNLTFETVEPASVSAALSPTKPGAQEVEVVATDIGSDYNLANGTEFSVGNFPTAEVDAVAKKDFSGGESREVAAVSESDIESLEEELEKELSQKAVKELEEKVEDGNDFLKDSISQQVTKTGFSNKVGDEASSLKLDLELEVSGVSVKKDLLVQLAREVLDNQVPSGYVLKDEQVEIKFKYVGEEDGVYEMETSIIANLLPELNPDEITDRVSGKYPHIAREYLNSIPGFVRAEIIIEPRLPGRLGNLPYQKKNISVEVAAER